MGKTIGKLDPLRGGDVLLEKVGLPNMFGEQTGYMTANERAEEEARQQRKLQDQQTATAEQAAKDARVDLGNNEILEIAEAAAADQAALVRRKNRQGLGPQMNIRRSLGL